MIDIVQDHEPCPAQKCIRQPEKNSARTSISWTFLLTAQHILLQHTRAIEYRIDYDPKTTARFLETG
jgi:hypothetical protein